MVIYIIMDKKRVESYIKSVGNDLRGIKFEETDDEVKLRIGNFFLTRKIDGDYNYAVKKLFEDFLTNTSSYYIKSFWEL
jgi:hypothetical protein